MLYPTVHAKHRKGAVASTDQIAGLIDDPLQNCINPKLLANGQTRLMEGQQLAVLLFETALNAADDAENCVGEGQRPDQHQPCDDDRAGPGEE